MNTKGNIANKNLYATWVDSQKKMIDTVTESTHNFTKDELVNETIDKGSELYKNWLDTQLTFMNEQTAKLESNPVNVLNPENVNATTKTWMKNQMEITKEFMEFSMNTMKEYMTSVNKAMPILNGNGEKMTKMFNANLNTFKKWNDTLTKNYEQMMTSFDDNTAKNAMLGMFNQADVYNKFVELWTPAIKAMQNNTFNTEMLNNLINPKEYKDFMDKMMGWNKDAMSNYSNMFNPTGTPMNEWMDQMSGMSKNWMNMMNPSANPANDLMKNFMNMFNGQTNPMMNNDLMKNFQKMFNMEYNPLMSNELMKNWMNAFNTHNNPMETIKNWMTMFNNMNQFTEMTKNFQKMFNMENNPMMNNDMMKNFQKMFNMENNPMMNSDMMKNFQKMFNMESNPMMNNDMMKNFQKMFNMESNPMMNNDMMKNFTNVFNMQSNPMMDMFKNMNGMNMSQFPMMNMNVNGTEMFANLMNTYNNMFSSAEHMFGPMFRMMTPNSTKANMEMMSSIANKMNQYQIKNAEMQYMTYTTGMKAMKNIADRLQEKMNKQEDFKGMNNFYTEWLNISDKIFVELYESDEFSKVQAEVAALSHNLKKEVEVLIEKMMVNIPVITRTEMDDTYKTIYDLKKRVKDLERTEKTSVAVKASPITESKATAAEVKSNRTVSPVKSTSAIASKTVVSKAKPAVKKTGRK